MDFVVVVFGLLLPLVLVVMYLRCHLNSCRWRWLCNVTDRYDDARGLYQCRRCKSLSMGSARPFLAESAERDDVEREIASR